MKKSKFVATGWPITSSAQVLPERLMHFHFRHLLGHEFLQL